MWTGRRRRLGAALPVAGLLAFGLPGAAAAAVDGQLQYQFEVSAAPVESYTHFFRELVQAGGYTRVILAHRRGEVTGIARALGAAVWPITDEEPCLFGCEPPCPESLLVNPTVARTSAPQECNDRVPGFAAAGLPPQVAEVLTTGIAPETTAATPDGSTGTGSARIGDVDFGTNTFAAAGSFSTATVQDPTAKLVASARSFVTELRLPGGGLASLTSRLDVTAVPGELPRVSFRLSFANAAGPGTRSGLDQANFTLSGTDIPISDLLQAFNDSLTTFGSQLRVLASFGVRVLAPTVGFTERGARYRVSAPVFTVGAEPGVSLPTPTRDGGLRIGVASFEGSYGAPDPALR
ncbi:MAG: hypothetical protein ACT4QF_11840 [Sporichthyaceae bacterium]